MKNSAAIWIIAVGAIVVVGLIIAAVSLLNRGGADPAPPPTIGAPSPDPTDPTSDPTPTDDATPTPTDDATPTPTDSPTPDPTPTDAAGGGVPVGWVEVPMGQSGTLRGWDDEVVGSLQVNSVTWDAECVDDFFNSEPTGTYVMLNVTATNDASATEPLMINPFFWDAYADGYGTDVTMALFCDVPDELPDDLQPGATATGNILLDVGTDTVWLGYSPTMGWTSEDPIWRVR